MPDSGTELGAVLMRRLLGVVAGVVLVGAVGGCTGGSGTAGASACAVPTAVSGGVDGRADAAPGGGGLRVVEKGITQVSKGFRVSLGAVVENTSGQVAYRARVTFAYSDAHGRSVVPPNRPELAMCRASGSR